LALGYYAYLLNALGPVMPFLRAELGLSYTVSSLHLSAFAVGILLAGLGADRIIKRFGRNRTFWAGILGMAVCTLLFLAGWQPVVTLSGALLMGTIGSLLIVIIPASLADRHGQNRAIAIAEANVVASFCSVLAPVIVGLFVWAELGWRGALVAPALAALIFSLLFRRVALPEPALPLRRRLQPQPKLPGLYWLYWSILVLVVSVEFCIIFWGATFLETERGFSRADAAFYLSLFLGAMALGRLGGSQLARQVRSEWLVLGSVGVCGLGFLLHWGVTLPLFTIGGLFLAGLGMANLYPQTLALAIGAAPAQTNEASARASLASGGAILSLPLLLGGLADQIGLYYAYGMVAVLLVFAGLSIVQAGRVGPQRLARKLTFSDSGCVEK
jgi:fucose permease